MTKAVHSRICPFCESSCGLRIEVDTVTGELTRISGDPDHPGSRGFLCPKSQAIAGLRRDPDRLRMPLLRKGNEFHEIGWDEALDRAAAGLKAVVAKHGKQCLGFYSGNPSASIAGLNIGIGALLGAMPAVYSNAGAIDCFPRFLVDSYLYGNLGHIPVPDIENTDFFLIFGGNPMVSNGSMLGAPNMPARLRALRERGAKLIVIDPRRTATAEIADDHFALRPGTDALLAMAMIETLFAEGLVKPGRLENALSGLDELRATVARYDADRVAPLVRIPADRIRQLARDFAAAKSAVAYARVGTNCQSFGTLAIWMVDCLNILTGNLDEPGGALFPTGILPQMLDMPYVGEQPPHGRWHSRVSGAPELGGTMPAHVIWEEIETPGPQQIRAMVIAAGNPVLSHPNADRISAALGQLDYLVAVDIYLNETTRHADIILPPMDHLKRSEFTMIYGNWMVESIGCYSAPIYPREAGDRDDFEILTELAARYADQPLASFTANYAENYVARITANLPRYPPGLSPAAALEMASGDNVPEKIYDVMLRGGPFGDGFGSHQDGLSLDLLKGNPSGVNYGPMTAGRFPDAIDTPDGRLQLAAPIFVDDLVRLEAAIAAGEFDTRFSLINRRHLRSNNSWAHNLPNLVKGPRRFTALINPVDALELGVTDGDMVRLRSRVGEISLPAEISDSVPSGVVSVPHGWSGKDPMVRLRVAQSIDAANVNVLSDDRQFDRPSGGAAFNGVPIEVSRL